jgi:hypothetical protein
MTVGQLKSILAGLPDNCEVEANVVIDGIEYYHDDEIEIVDHRIENYRFPDGEEKTTLILNCKEI